jgi:hypothetical protein
MVQDSEIESPLGLRSKGEASAWVILRLWELMGGLGYLPEGSLGEGFFEVVRDIFPGGDLAQAGFGEVGTSYALVV